MITGIANASTMLPGELSVDTNSNITVAVPSGMSMLTSNTINITSSQHNDEIIDDTLEKYSLNYITVTHKVAEHELMKLKETAPDYADHIKKNLTEKATEEVSKKLTFTKKFDKDLDVHHFNGRVWVFTDDELKRLIKEVTHAR